MRKIKNIGFALAIDNALDQQHCFALAIDTVMRYINNIVLHWL